MNMQEDEDDEMLLVGFSAGALYKRADYLDKEEAAKSHPNRYAHTHTHTHTHLYTPTYTHTQAHAHTHIHLKHTHTPKTHTHATHTHTHTCRTYYFRKPEAEDLNKLVQLSTRQLKVRDICDESLCPPLPHPVRFVNCIFVREKFVREKGHSAICERFDREKRMVHVEKCRDAAAYVHLYMYIHIHI